MVAFKLLSGDYNLLLLDQLLKFPELKLIGCCNELNAGYVLLVLISVGVDRGVWEHRSAFLVETDAASSCFDFSQRTLTTHLWVSLLPSLLPPSLKLRRRWMRPEERRVGHGGDLHGRWLERGQCCRRGVFG